MSDGQRRGALGGERNAVRGRHTPRRNSMSACGVGRVRSRLAASGPVPSASVRRVGGHPAEVQ